MERALFGYVIKCVNTETQRTQYGKVFAAEADHFSEDGQPIDALAAAESARQFGETAARHQYAELSWSLVTLYA